MSDHNAIEALAGVLPIEIDEGCVMFGGYHYDLGDDSHRLDLAQLLIENLRDKGYRVVPS